MIQDYNSALAIAQDRANRSKNLMFLFHISGGGYYVSTIYEHPYVYEMCIVDKTDVILPEDDWMDILEKKARH